MGSTKTVFGLLQAIPLATGWLTLEFPGVVDVLSVFVVTLIGGVAFHFVAWIHRRGSAPRASPRLGAGLGSAVLATVPWFLIIWAIALLNDNYVIMTIGLFWTPLLGIWSSGSMALLRIGPYK